MLISNLYIVIGEMSIQVLCPFFNLVVWVFVVELEEFWFYDNDVGNQWRMLSRGVMLT